MELSRPREAPPQEDAAALRPADGRASPSARRRRARRPTAYRKRRSPPPPPGQSAGKPPTTAGHPRKRRRARGGGETQATPSTDPRLTHLTGAASPPARSRRRPDGQGRAGLGWAGQRPAATRNSLSHLTAATAPFRRITVPAPAPLRSRRCAEAGPDSRRAAPTEPPPARAITGRERGPDPGWGWYRPPEVEPRGGGRGGERRGGKRRGGGGGQRACAARGRVGGARRDVTAREGGRPAPAPSEPALRRHRTARRSLSKKNLTPAEKNPGLAECLFPTRLKISLKSPVGSRHRARFRRWVKRERPTEGGRFRGPLPGVAGSGGRALGRRSSASASGTRGAREGLGLRP